MNERLYDRYFDMFCVDELRILSLFFSDDTVLISYYMEDLQKVLNSLHLYCSKWDISGNIDNTDVMVCIKKVIDQKMRKCWLILR